MTYCVGFTFTKVSILAQYRRIFSFREARIPNYIVLALCVATGIVAFLTFALTCIPVDAFWDVLKKQTARCVDEDKYVWIRATELDLC